ncbi:MAG: hypothetical protein IJE46_03000 [Clostridia bacterium]|nr:hypothetical protein [Clostridia bacterium]
MQNYKVVLEYIGAKYNGWQKQGNNKNTIQGKLENILAELSGEQVEIYGSGRTDKGVHAKCQVASFKLDKEMYCEFLRNYLNKYLLLT